MGKWAVCLATIRPELAVRWLEHWQKVFDLHKADVYIMQDTSVANIPSEPNIHVFDHTNALDEFGENSWVIPKHTDTCRSYAMLQAYKHGYDYYLTLDDDCLPSGDPIGAYETMFRPQQAYAYKYFDVGSFFGYKHHVRGYPYGIRNQYGVAAQYGVWLNFPDYDGLTSIEEDITPEYDISSDIVAVPKYSGLTGCIMNAAFSHKYMPAMYQLCMGEKAGYDRFGDIWSALIMKRIADHLEDIVLMNGLARVVHEKASDPRKCLTKEMPAMTKNEKLWENLLAIKLAGNTPLECFVEIAESGAIPEPHQEAMLLWAKVLEQY